MVSHLLEQTDVLLTIGIGLLAGDVQAAVKPLAAP
jgi:hypothetical protein